MPSVITGIHCFKAANDKVSTSDSSRSIIIVVTTFTVYKHTILCDTLQVLNKSYILSVIASTNIYLYLP